MLGSFLLTTLFECRAHAIDTLKAATVGMLFIAVAALAFP